MSKIFVLDTNVLLYDPQAIYKFRENQIVIPMTVIEEMDRFKRDENETGRNAIQVSRFLDDLRRKGSLAEGIALDTGGSLRVVVYDEKVMKGLPPELREERGDNRLLAVALDIKEKLPQYPVIFVTKDTHLRILADVLGLVAEDYEIEEMSDDTNLVGQHKQFNLDGLSNENLSPEIIEAMKDIKIVAGPGPITKSIEFDEDAYQAVCQFLVTSAQ